MGYAAFVHMAFVSGWSLAPQSGPMSKTESEVFVSGVAQSSVNSIENECRWANNVVNIDSASAVV